ncbi:hypothetical protein FE845_09035 [Marinobacter sp. 1-4A]|uniref:hypothetical protein n=1 Tax=Marinobacter sp. 1-4A TaxID=2582919 RepID=UPI001903C755|nr:hypothetical protein [Marinobacter sp. 1-4A]MBK1851484.1 hypothetical protein [Marinobacter sp. 1-4A]
MMKLCIASLLLFSSILNAQVPVFVLENQLQHKGLIDNFLPIANQSHITFAAIEVRKDEEGCAFYPERLGPLLFYQICKNARSLLFEEPQESVNKQPRSFELKKDQYVANISGNFVILFDLTVVDRINGIIVAENTHRSSYFSAHRALFRAKTASLIYYDYSDSGLFSKPKGGWYEFDYKTGEKRRLASLETHCHYIWCWVPRDVDSVLLVEDKWVVALESLNFRGPSWLELSVYSVNDMQLVQRIRLLDDAVPALNDLEWINGTLVVSYRLGKEYIQRHYVFSQSVLERNDKK